MMKRLLGLIDEKFGRIYRYIETINEKYSKDVQEDDIQRYHWALWFDGNYKESFKYIDKLKIHFRNLMLNDRDKLLNQVENYVISLEQVFYAFKEVFVDKINGICLAPFYNHPITGVFTREGNIINIVSVRY